MLGDRHVDDPSTLVREDHEYEQQPERDRRHDKQVSGHALARVIGEEGPPRLGRWAWMPSHVRGDGRLTHRDPELQKFPPNPRRTPKWIRGRHFANQHADVVRHGRAAGAVSALPRPEQAKAAPMPCEHRCRLDDMERRAPAAPSARHPHPQHTIGGRQAKAWAARAIRDRQLMPKGEDLQMQGRA
jgi:hypothetical protein